MPFEKNDPNINRLGRPKKSDNLEDNARNILSIALSSLKGKVKELSSTQHIKLVGVLMPYLLPKLQSVNFEDREEFENMSEEDINRIINRILDGYNSKER